MDLKAARYLDAIAQDRSMTVAARRLGVAQSWISTRVHRLECDCGFLILKRSARSVEFTPEGEVMLNLARQLLDSWREVKLGIAEIQRQTMVNIGVSADVPIDARSMLFDLLIRQKRFKFEMHAYEDRTSMHLLESGQIDAALFVSSSASRYKHREISTVLVGSTGIDIQLPLDHSLAGLAGLTDRDLAGLDIVLAHPDTYARGASDELLDLLRGAGANIVASPDPDVAIIEAYAKSLGVATLSSRSRPPAVSGCIRIPFAWEVQSELHFAWRTNDRRDAIEHIKQAAMSLWT